MVGLWLLLFLLVVVEVVAVEVVVVEEVEVPDVMFFVFFLCETHCPFIFTQIFLLLLQIEAASLIGIHLPFLRCQEIQMSIGSRMFFCPTEPLPSNSSFCFLNES